MKRKWSAKIISVVAAAAIAVSPLGTSLTTLEVSAASNETVKKPGIQIDEKMPLENDYARNLAELHFTITNAQEGVEYYYIVDDGKDSIDEIHISDEQFLIQCRNDEVVSSSIKKYEGAKTKVSLHYVWARTEHTGRLRIVGIKNHTASAIATVALPFQSYIKTPKITIMDMQDKVISADTIVAHNTPIKFSISNFQDTCYVWDVNHQQKIERNVKYAYAVMTKKEVEDHFPDGAAEFCGSYGTSYDESFEYMGFQTCEDERSEIEIPANTGTADEEWTIIVLGYADRQDENDIRYLVGGATATVTQAGTIPTPESTVKIGTQTISPKSNGQYEIPFNTKDASITINTKPGYQYFYTNESEIILDKEYENDLYVENGEVKITYGKTKKIFPYTVPISVPAVYDNIYRSSNAEERYNVTVVAVRVGEDNQTLETSAQVHIRTQQIQTMLQTPMFRIDTKGVTEEATGENGECNIKMPYGATEAEIGVFWKYSTLHELYTYYYTTDGSEPTVDSPHFQTAYAQMPSVPAPEEGDIRVVKMFCIDASGCQSRTSVLNLHFPEIVTASDLDVRADGESQEADEEGVVTLPNRQDFSVNFSGKDIWTYYYTLDGTEPTKDSKFLTGEKEYEISSEEIKETCSEAYNSDEESEITVRIKAMDADSHMSEEIQKKIILRKAAYAPEVKEEKTENGRLLTLSTNPDFYTKENQSKIKFAYRFDNPDVDIKNEETKVLEGDAVIDGKAELTIEAPDSEEAVEQTLYAVTYVGDKKSEVAEFKLVFEAQLAVPQINVPETSPNRTDAVFTLTPQSSAGTIKYFYSLGGIPAFVDTTTGVSKEYDITDEKGVTITAPDTDEESSVRVNVLAVRAEDITEDYNLKSGAVTQRAEKIVTFAAKQEEPEESEQPSKEPTATKTPAASAEPSMPANPVVPTEPTVTPSATEQAPAATPSAAPTETVSSPSAVPEVTPMPTLKPASTPIPTETSTEIPTPSAAQPTTEPAVEVLSANGQNEILAIDFAQYLETDTADTTQKKVQAAKGQTLKTKGASYMVTSKTGTTPTVKYTGNTAKQAKVTIPSAVTVNGVKYKVTAVAANAFKNNKNVKQVVIPSSVKTIGAGAFQNCTKLTKVTLSSNTTEIGKQAFSGCKSLKSMTIPAKVSKIGANAFYGDNALKSLVIKSSSIKTVGKKAFQGTNRNFAVKVSSKMTAAQKKALVKKLKAAGIAKTAKIK